MCESVPGRIFSANVSYVADKPQQAFKAQGNLQGQKKLISQSASE